MFSPISEETKQFLLGIGIVLLIGYAVIGLIWAGLTVSGLRSGSRASGSYRIVCLLQTLATGLLSVCWWVPLLGGFLPRDAGEVLVAVIAPFFGVSFLGTVVMVPTRLLMALARRASKPGEGRSQVP